MSIYNSVGGKMALIDNEIVNKIRKSNDIVDVISNYIDLVPKGKNYFGVCPFHDDHSPSMSVSREKQIYRCFTCGASGNVISFVMNYENISFIDALKKLGDRVGIHLNIKSKKVDSKYSELYEIYKLSTNFYKNNLNSPLGEKAKEYLGSRRITEEMIKTFDIGLSLNDSLSKMLIRKYDKSKLISVGLSHEYNGKISDLFLNRIMFPIKDLDGNIVAYSGRKYDESDAPKYINTKETVIFKKGKVLYNYFDAKEEIRRKKEVIICEGFMEVIRLNSINIKNVVALMGTSFTSDQLEVVKKLNVDVVLNLDNDDAGKLAAFQIGEVLLKNNIKSTVIVFDRYKDTDELVMNDGADAFIKAYNNKISYIDYKLHYLKSNKNLSDSVELAKYINEAIESINEIGDDVLREIKAKELSSEFDISLEMIKSKLVNISVKPKEVVKTKKVILTDKYRKSEIRIIYLMLNNKEVIRNYEKNLGFLVNDDMKKLANEIVYFKQINGGWDYADFITYVMNKPWLKETLDIVLNTEQMEEYTKEELDDYFTTIKKHEVEKQINRLTNKMKETLDIEEKIKIAKRIENIKKEVLEW